MFASPDGFHWVRTIGAGTIFVVAEGEAQGRPAVCKRLRPRLLAEPLAQRAMRREIEALGALQQAVVPRLLAEGSDGHGPFLIETRHPGATLRQLVEAFMARDGAVPGAFAVAVARLGFEALAAFHEAADERGPLMAVHGDVGPDHLVVAPAGPQERGRIGLVDFGMARSRDLAGEPSERGTLPFVAPEIARGDRPLDQPADCFALAATLLFAVIGREPCEAEEASARLVEVAERGVDLDVLAHAEVADPLRRALTEALAYERARRCTSARALLAMLR